MSAAQRTYFFQHMHAVIIHAQAVSGTDTFMPNHVRAHVHVRKHTHERFLIIRAHCGNDLCLLDTLSWLWSRLSVESSRFTRTKEM